MSEIGDELRELAGELGPASGNRLLRLAADVDRLALSERRKGNHARRNARQRDAYKRTLMKVRAAVRDVRRTLED